MLMAICGAGLLVCFLAIVLLIVFYVKQKSFVLPMILFVLGLLVAAGSLGLKAGGWLDGGLDAIPEFLGLKEDGPDDSQEGDQDLSDDPGGPADIISLEALSTIFEMMLSDSYSGCSIVEENGGITAGVWAGGAAEALAAAKGAEGTEGWTAVRESASGVAASLRKTMDSVGYTETPVTLNLLSDQDQSTILLSILNGEITYDALSEDAGPEPAAPANAVRNAPEPEASSAPPAVPDSPPAESAQPSGQPEEEPEEQPEEPPEEPPAAGPDLPPENGAASSGPPSKEPQLPPDEG